VTCIKKKKKGRCTNSQGRGGGGGRETGERKKGKGGKNWWDLAIVLPGRIRNHEPPRANESSKIGSWPKEWRKKEKGVGKRDKKEKWMTIPIGTRQSAEGRMLREKRDAKKKRGNETK